MHKFNGGLVHGRTDALTYANIIGTADFLWLNTYTLIPLHSGNGQFAEGIRSFLLGQVSLALIEAFKK